MPTSWTNDPVVPGATQIKALHITELRNAVNASRSSLNLPSYPFTDSSVTPSGPPIRAIHFGEIRSAIQDLWYRKRLGRLPNWTVGTSPSSSRTIRADDMNYLRHWMNTYENSSSLHDPQGVVSFMFDPMPPDRSDAYIINTSWADDIVNLKPNGRRLLIRTPIYSNREDNNISNYYDDYSTATSIYGSRGCSVGGILGGEFYQICVNNDQYTYCSNHSLGSNDPFSNPYIEVFSGRARDFAAAVSGSGLTTFWIWNEPNLQPAVLGDVSRCSLEIWGPDPASMAPEAFASLLYRTCHEIRSRVPDATLYAGSLFLVDSVSSIDAANAYLDAMYRYLIEHNSSLPGSGYGWDAISVNLNLGISSSRIQYLWSSLTATQAKYGDFSSIIVGEWGVRNDQISSVNPTNLYNSLKAYFPTMYFFEHPAFTRNDFDDRGTTNWDYDDDNHEYDLTNSSELTWYSILQSLYLNAD